MLGEQIAEGHGKRIARRVLKSDGVGLKVEVTFEGAGKVLGMDVQEMGTYTSVMRPDGSLFGEGQGAIVTSTGDVATWTGSGVGKIGPGGGVSYRGAVYYYSASPKLSRLNTVAAVFEYESSADGSTHSKTWEWK